MVRRAGLILSKAFGAHKGQRPPTLPWAGTFHAIGARLLREYAERVGLKASFTIHDRGDSEDLLAIVRHRLGLSKTEKRFPGKEVCLAIYSRVVNSAAPLSEVLKSAFPQFTDWEPQLKDLFEAYVGEKQSQNVLDYDDLLLYWSYIVAEPELAREIGCRFDHVLVDEYQDTNRLQAKILWDMKPDGKGLTVVGDDAQSIYSFRAATVRNILDFPQQFEPKATIVTLERNYRSTQPILAASNAVIGLASERYTKNLWTERLSSERPGLVTVRDAADQARCVADQMSWGRSTFKWSAKWSAGVSATSKVVLGAEHAGAERNETPQRRPRAAKGRPEQSYRRGARSDCSVLGQQRPSTSDLAGRRCQGKPGEGVCSLAVTARIPCPEAIARRSKTE